MLPVHKVHSRGPFMRYIHADVFARLDIHGLSVRSVLRGNLFYTGGFARFAHSVDSTWPVHAIRSRDPFTRSVHALCSRGRFDAVKLSRFVHDIRFTLSASPGTLHAVKTARSVRRGPFMRYAYAVGFTRSVQAISYMQLAFFPDGFHAARLHGRYFRDPFKPQVGISLPAHATRFAQSVS